jgi:UDP-glucose 4-epimerase
MGKKRIIILGGLGFIGRNLFNSLVRENYDVTILADQIHDSAEIHGIRKNIIIGSILDKDFVEKSLRGFDVIFSLAGSSGASHSIKNPYHDLDTNLKGHLNILEACRMYNPKALLIFPSTRLVYGKPEHNPVDETHPLKPESIYAIHKLTTEHYYLLYKRLHNLNCVVFRISNPYGPYQRFGSNNYGILNLFIHKALVDKEIEIFGEGNQKRDFIYIDDLTNLLIQSIDNDNMFGNIYNVGYGKGISLKETASLIKRYVPDLRITFKEWPEIEQKIETGDYISDIQLLKKEIGWEPRVTMEEGIKQTVRFYEQKSK